MRTLRGEGLKLGKKPGALTVRTSKQDVHGYRLKLGKKPGALTEPDAPRPTTPIASGPFPC